jgi:hypothetical protein
MTIVNRCALCGEPFRQVLVEGQMLPEIWDGEDGFQYCSEDHAYLTITALMVHLLKETKFH